MGWSRLAGLILLLSCTTTSKSLISVSSSRYARRLASLHVGVEEWAVEAGVSSRLVCSGGISPSSVEDGAGETGELLGSSWEDVSTTRGGGCWWARFCC